MGKHVHCELIKAWADGAKIQIKDYDGIWKDTDPTWHEDWEYRLKPEKKEIVIRGRMILEPNFCRFRPPKSYESDNIELVFYDDQLVSSRVIELDGQVSVYEFNKC